MSRPTFGSLFSGIGGFDLGLEAAGWACAFQVEVDPFCTKVLERHWPHVPRYRDIRTVAVLGEPERDALRDGDGGAAAVGGQHQRPVPGAVDLLCGGFPCQDLSVAGRRAGLAGARSGLFFEFVRLATELRPRWLLLESVPGLLSSNGGRDFAVVLAALGDAGYGVGWRVLDSRWFGVPQRRRRVFLVGHLGGPCPYAVLFEPPGVLGDLTPGGEAGEEPAHCLRGGLAGGRTSDDPDRVTYALTAPGRKGGDPSTDTYITAASHDTSPPLMAGGFDASEDGRGRKAFAFAWQQGDDSPHTGTGRGRSWVARAGDYTGSLSTTRHDAVAFDHTQDPVSSASAVPTLNEDGQAVATGAAVRRLTPTECERLQAFPDGWTCLCGVEPYITAGCRCPDGPRYAALGNAVTTSVVEWIGRRLHSEHIGT